MADERTHVSRGTGQRPSPVSDLWHVSEDDSIQRFEIGDLLDRHAEAGIEPRIVPKLWPVWEQVIDSTSSSVASGCAT